MKNKKEEERTFMDRGKEANQRLEPLITITALSIQFLSSFSNRDLMVLCSAA